MTSLKYFVTGATGFLGSALVKTLLAEGHEVHALVRNPDREGCWRLANELPQLHLLHGDLDGLSLVRAHIIGLRPNVIVHLGWDGISSDARNSPNQLIQNVQSSLTLLDICREASCPVFVGLGSQAEYGSTNERLYEHSPCKPTTAYGVAKHALSQLTLKFGDITATRVLWFRLFSAYGPQDHPGHLLPNLIGAMLQGDCPPLTKGEQTWDFLYVQDAIDAMLAAIESPSASGVFNLAAGEQHTLRDVIKMVRDKIDPSIFLRFGELAYRPDQVMTLDASIERLESAAHWSPKVALEQGLQATVDWYRNANAGPHRRA